MTQTTTPAARPDLAAPELVADPYGGWDRLREQGPVLRGRFLDGSPVWYVTRFEDVGVVLSDPRLVNDPHDVAGSDVDAREDLRRMMGLSAELALNHQHDHGRRPARPHPAEPPVKAHADAAATAS